MVSSDDIFQVKSFSNAKVLFDSRLIKEVGTHIFDPVHLADQNLIVGQSRGRGASNFFRYNDQEWVLRHFRRGGWVARFVEDLYLGLNPEKSRAFQEFHLLSSMLNEGLPVPQPIAAAYWPHGVCHRQDLITKRIPQAIPLAEVLEKQSLGSEAWAQIGSVLWQFHHKGIYHADLNARNILIDNTGAAFLIDFDRGRQMSGEGWQENNLRRLLRSLQKFKKNVSEFNFTKNDWESLLSGYASSKG